MSVAASIRIAWAKFESLSIRANGLLDVSEGYSVELPIARVFDLTAPDVLSKIGRCFEVILDVETGEFF